MDPPARVMSGVGVRVIGKTVPVLPLDIEASIE